MTSIMHHDRENDHKKMIHKKIYKKMTITTKTKQQKFGKYNTYHELPFMKMDSASKGILLEAVLIITTFQLVG